MFIRVNPAPWMVKLLNDLHFRLRFGVRRCSAAFAGKCEPHFALAYNVDLRAAEHRRPPKYGRHSENFKKAGIIPSAAVPSEKFKKMCALFSSATCVSMPACHRVTFLPQVIGKLQLHLQRGVVRHRVEMRVKLGH